MLFIVGPTASGKTSRAVDIARCIGAEIISADSRQLYQGMDIGTGKDLHEYGDVPYHMIDICPAGYKYNLFEYLKDYTLTIDRINRQGKQAIVCGGTGLYIESIIKGIQLPPVPENPELRKSLDGKTILELKSILEGYKTLHNTTDVDTCQRAIRAIEIAEYYHSNPDKAAQTHPKPLDDAIVVGIDIPRQERRQRITARLHARLDAGMVDEVAGLLRSGIPPENLIYYGLEYKFITQYVIGQINYETMIKELEIAIHQFAKRQMTWFRGMERRGTPIHWLPYNMTKEEFTSQVIALIENQRI